MNISLIPRALVAGFLLALSNPAPAEQGLNATFPAKRCAPLVFTAGAFGEDRQFIVDTGTSVTLLDDQFEKSLEKLGTTESRTSAGTVKFTTYSQPQLAVSGMPLSSTGAAVVLDMSEIAAATGQPIEGIAGTNILKHYIVWLAVDDGQFSILNKLPQLPGKAFPLKSDGRGCLTTELGFGKNEIREHFLIDTGSLTELTLRANAFDFLESVGDITKVREIVVVSAKGPVRRKEGVISTVILGDWAHKEIIVSRGSTFNIVGLNYLNRYTATIDFPRKRLSLKPNKHFSEKSRRTCLGVGIYNRKDSVALKYVIAHSPAARAGLKADDIIESVDGEKVTATDLYPIRRLFEKEGKTVVLSVRRQSRVASVKIKLTDF